MPRDRKRVEEIRARLAAVTEGFWDGMAVPPVIAVSKRRAEVLHDAPRERWSFPIKAVKDSKGARHTRFIAQVFHTLGTPVEETEANHEFLKNAKADIAWLLENGGKRDGRGEK